MKFNYKPSFDRSFKKLRDEKRQRYVSEAIKIFEECLIKGNPPVPGLGLKRLRGSIWEFRSNLSDRVLIFWDGDYVSYGFTGSHDEIKRFLKNG